MLSFYLTSDHLISYYSTILLSIGCYVYDRIFSTLHITLSAINAMLSRIPNAIFENDFIRYMVTLNV